MVATGDVGRFPLLSARLRTQRAGHWGAGCRKQAGWGCVPHPPQKETAMSVRITRRSFLQGTAAVALASPPAFAQGKPVKIGLLTVKTGPLAAGGIQMEQGTVCFLKDRNYTLAGRKVELVVAV